MPSASLVTENGDVKDDRFFAITEEDIPFEEELLRNPFSVRTWRRYIEHKEVSPFEHRVFVYERAVKQLPGSYKIWKEYLDLRRNKVLGTNPSKNSKEWESVNHCFERALILLHKMPRIWLDYCAFLMNQPYITKTRRTFDRALRALPITQHSRVWELFLEFARNAGGETAIRIFRRYLKLEPNHVEDYLVLLKSMKRYNELATKLCSVLDNERFQSAYGKSHYQLWMELCDLICSHPREIKGLQVEAIIRDGIKRFTDQVGKLWNSLAKYWVLLENFEKARDVYEEGIATVKTVRDFTQIFEAYSRFEEAVIASKTEMAGERAERGEIDPIEDLELDLRIMRLERLVDRRPFLVNDVLLRQNPNNVAEWQKRATLHGDDLAQVVKTYNKAIQTINPKKAAGKLHDLWINYAKYHEDAGRLEEAAKVFERAVKVNYKAVNDLADIWCECAEMYLRHEEFGKALEVLGRATVAPRNPNINFHDDSLPVQQRLFKSLRLWTFYVDLEESIGTIESTRSVYDRILDLRIATPQIIVNYALFLEENKYYEESFKVYERGIDLFGYPVAFEIWNTYLSKFIDRYGGSKLERARDLFEQALEGCPTKYAKDLYLMYGQLEENHGLAKHAMRIYDRATRGVSDEDRLEMFNFYIAKARSNFGATATREIYEKAIEALPDRQVAEICIQYADLETKLGEVDRARVIYGYASQFCDPRATPVFWKTWQDFEVKHGNEDTFKEMLRIKRSVQARFNTEVNFVSAQMLAARQNKNAAAAAAAAAATQAQIQAGNAMELLEQQQQTTGDGSAAMKHTMTFVKSTETTATDTVANPDEIEIDEDM